MSNDMIIWSYRLATFAMVEGAVLLWLGMIYGFWMMLVAVIYKELMYGYICPTCGAHLDPQERCEECTEQKLKDQRESERIKSLLSVGKDAQYELVLS